MAGHLDIARRADGAVLLRIHHRRRSAFLFVGAMVLGAFALKTHNVVSSLVAGLAVVVSFGILFYEFVVLVDGTRGLAGIRFAGVGLGQPDVFLRDELTLLVERFERRGPVSTDEPRARIEGIDYHLSLRTRHGEILIVTRRHVTEIRAEAARVAAALHLWVEERGILPAALESGQ